MWVKCISSPKRAKLLLGWKRRGKTCKEEIQPDQSQKWLNATGKKCGGIVCFAIGMPQHALAGTCIRSLPQVGRALKRIDFVFGRRYETSIKREEKLSANQKNEWKPGHPPACQTVNPLVLSWQQILVLATHATDTSWQNYCSCCWLQRCHSDWVSQPRFRHTLCVATHEEADTMFLQWTTKHPALLFYKT